MLQKWALMDINARKYGAAFGLCKWRYEKDGRGKVIFDGNDMQVLNNRDIAHDLTANSVENCNWIQVRLYPTMDELERVNDSRGKIIYKNLDELRQAIGRDSDEGSGGDSRSSALTSRNRAISKLEIDPYGKDKVFKSVEVVTEYRRDRWITFAPRHGIVLRDIRNPYDNYEIPITMLRYYVIDDDLYGLSEIEPIQGLQKAINALLCQYVDEINQNLYSPIAIGPGVRQHTLEWGKGARWIMNNPLTDFRLVESKSNAAQFFNNTYSVLVAAMMNALGESSLGVSNLQPFQADKTATEVKALQLQRNARDNYNQLMLADAMKRQLMLWHSMNQKLIFGEDSKKPYVIRIVGRDAIKYFVERGLHDIVLSEEAVKVLKTYSEVLGIPPEELQEKAGINPEDLSVPKYPVNVSEEKGKISLKPKMTLSPGGEMAEILIEPEDVKGMYDFSVDVESMTVTADEERRQARQTAVSLLVSNPNILALLQQEGVKPKFKELFTTWLDDLGFSDAERYFEKSEQTMGAGGAMGGEMPPANQPAGQDGAGSVQDLLKMFGGGRNPAQPQGEPMPQAGAGANQLARVISPQGQETAPINQNLGQPNPDFYQRIVSKYGTGQ
jgi:hypothetical protein